MDAADCNLLLVWPRSAEFAGAANQDCPWLGGDEQLGQSTLCKPVSVFLHKRDDIGGFAFDREFARPDEHGKPRLPVSIWRAIGLHFRAAQAADDALRQDAFNEDVLVENHA